LAKQFQYIYSEYKSNKSKLEQERKLIDQAILASKKKIYEKRATKMLVNPKTPEKPNSLEELQQIYIKLGTIEKVAKYFGVVENTIFDWKRKFKAEEEKIK